MLAIPSQHVPAFNKAAIQPLLALTGRPGSLINAGKKAGEAVSLAALPQAQPAPQVVPPESPPRPR